MLVLKKVVVHYGGVVALDEVSLEAETGTTTALIGANGAGKSTCLRLISGLIRVTSGEVWFDGKRIDRKEPDKIVKLGICHVPEGKRLFLEMSVNDNLMMGAFLRKDRSKIQIDLKRVYDYFPSLVRARNRQASSLSGGEQQMLAMGRGLMANPTFLLLDEPSLGLSPIITQEVAAIIKLIAQEGVSILLIEQNARLALNLSTKSYVLETGKVTLEGDSPQFHRNDYVRKAYLGI